MLEFAIVVSKALPFKPNPLRYNPKQLENPPALLTVATKVNCKSFLEIKPHAAGNVLEV